jgi:hypothetical protein
LRPPMPTALPADAGWPPATWSKPMAGAW